MAMAGVLFQRLMRFGAQLTQRSAVHRSAHHHQTFSRATSYRGSGGTEWRLFHSSVAGSASDHPDSSDDSTPPSSFPSSPEEGTDPLDFETIIDEDAMDEGNIILDEATRKLLGMENREQDAGDSVMDKGTASRGRNSRDNLQSQLSELERLPILLVRCSFNNTYVNIQDHTGRLLTWISAGSEGYKGARKGTTFAAQAVGLAAAIKARDLGMQKIRVKLKGPGVGRQYSLKGFEQGGLKIAAIQDVTPVAHNGCRPRKRRRV